MKNIKRLPSSTLTEQLERDAAKVFGKINTREIQQITKELICRLNNSDCTPAECKEVVDYINRVHSWCGIQKRYKVNA